MANVTELQHLATLRVKRKQAIKRQPEMRRRVSPSIRRGVIGLGLSVGLNAVSGAQINQEPFTQQVPTEERADTPVSEQAKAQQEILHKQKMAKERHENRLRAQSLAMPAELNTYTQNLADAGRDYVSDMYAQEMEMRGVNGLLAQQYGGQERSMTNKVLKLQMEKMKKEAAKVVIKEAKKALNTAMKEGFKAGKDSLTKGLWSAFAQGGVVESEGMALESWFGSGTITTSYQALLGALNNGEGLLKGYLSFMEPTPCKTPAAAIKDPKSLMKPNGLMTTLYDAFVMMILAPVYVLLLFAIFILINLFVVAVIFPFAMAANGIMDIANFFGIGL